jgi:uncharacterized protein YgbK (DUF1537 family)
VPGFLCLADDLTGALEVGAKFAVSGVSSTVRLRPDPACRAFALVIDAATRHLVPHAAESEVRRLAGTALHPNLRCVYVKTDSTLRGNIGAQFRGLMSACPGLPLFYVPAYPGLGRTVVGGRLYVDGVPVDRSPYGLDLLNPAREAWIPALLRPLPVECLRHPGDLAASRPGTVYVFDGASEDEVRETARIIAGMEGLTLAAGPAALAGHLAELADVPRERPQSVPPLRSCLVVSGSLHDRSRAQIRAALEAGWPSAPPEQVPDLISRFGWVVLELTGHPELTGEAFAARTGELVSQLLNRTDPDALVVFGGDTCRGIVDALGGPPLYPVSEVLAGVPAARISGGDLTGAGGRRCLYLITKAGGFGPPDVLMRIRERSRPA